MTEDEMVGWHHLLQFSCHSVTSDSLKPHVAACQASLSITNSWSLLTTPVYHVSDAIQPSHPLSSPSPPALNLSQLSLNTKLKV